MTTGEDRVRIKFNPSAESSVDQIKQDTAKLIDLCEMLNNSETSSAERGRLFALAQTAYETAAMWAVKAATTGK
jgi:hypothetical protein